MATFTLDTAKFWFKNSTLTFGYLLLRTNYSYLLDYAQDHKAIKNSIEKVNDTINKTRNDCRKDAGKTSAIFQ